jgi:Transposase DDE domain
MGLHEKIAKLGNNLKNVIQSIIDPEQMRKMARETGFVQRCSSRLAGDEFVQLLIIESVDGEKNTLRGAIDTLTQLKSKAVMTVQALSQRINTKSAADLIESVFEKTLQAVMNQINHVITFSNKNLELLRFFSKVYIQDSSESQLNAALKDEYKGSGGGSGNGKGDASFKVDLIYEYKNKILSYFKVTDRREPDVILGENIVEVIKKGDLVIRDLGYSCVKVFRQIQEIGAFFLSRLHANLNVYLNLQDTQAILLGGFLEKKAKKSGIVDTMIYIGKEMFQCRMVAYRVPPEIEKNRREEYLKECKKRKRKPNKEYIKRLSFTIFITNVTVTMWPAEVIGTIYRLRWQVELIFKSWKSNLKFDFLEGTNIFRIKCLIYARLTTILMMFTVYTCIDKVTLELLEKEISIHKVIDWLTKNGRFFGIVINGFCKGLWKSLVRDSKQILCKDKRIQRKTTRELVEHEMPFGCVTC